MKHLIIGLSLFFSTTAFAVDCKYSNFINHFRRNHPELKSVQKWDGNLWLNPDGTWQLNLVFKYNNRDNLGFIVLKPDCSLFTNGYFPLEPVNVFGP